MDAGNDITSVDYNFLDLPTKIEFKTGTLEMTYDANGIKLKQKMTPNANSGGTAKETHYHGAIEYENGKRTSIHHESGRVVYNGMLPIETGFLNEYNEWSISDHLGNTRVRFVDKDGDGEIEQEPDAVNPLTNEVVGSYHYYPFGMKWDGYKIDETDRNLSDQLGVKLKYQYNGIEHEDEIGSGLGLTTYRIHDPAVARWYQVDPKAEGAYGQTPYNSMFNNPISMSDPDGDFPWLIAAYAAVGAIQGYQNGGGINGAIKGGLLGAANGYLAGINPLKLGFGKGFGLNIAPQISIGSNGIGLGFNSTLGWSKGGFTAGLNLGGAGYGIGANDGSTFYEGRVGLGLAWTKGGYYEIGVNQFFSGETSQRTGFISAGYNKDKWLYTFDNDV